MINNATDTENHAVQSKSKHKCLILKLNLQILKGEITQKCRFCWNQMLPRAVPIKSSNKSTIWNFPAAVKVRFESQVSLWEYLAMLSN